MSAPPRSPDGAYAGLCKCQSTLRPDQSRSRHLLQRFGSPRKTCHPIHPFCLPVPRWAMGHQRRQLQVSQWRFAAAFAAVMVAVDCRWKGETCGSQINPVQSSGGVSGKPPFFRQLSRSVVGHCRPPGGPNPQSGPWANGVTPVFVSMSYPACACRWAVCGFNVRNDDQLVELATVHMRGHANGGPDAVPNGLTFCLALHEAGNRDRIGLTDDGRTLVSPAMMLRGQAESKASAVMGESLELCTRLSVPTVPTMYVQVSLWCDAGTP